MISVATELVNIMVTSKLAFSPEQFKLLHERRKICYENHCHVTTIQLLALGHVDNKMRT